jgi:hypothetical protein
VSRKVHQGAKDGAMMSHRTKPQLTTPLTNIMCSEDPQEVQTRSDTRGVRMRREDEIDNDEHFGCFLTKIFIKLVYEIGEGGV